mgnify:CR=1 FL=1
MKAILIYLSFSLVAALDLTLHNLAVQQLRELYLPQILSHITEFQLGPIEYNKKWAGINITYTDVMFNFTDGPDTLAVRFNPTVNGVDMALMGVNLNIVSNFTEWLTILKSDGMIIADITNVHLVMSIGLGAQPVGSELAPLITNITNVKFIFDEAKSSIRVTGGSFTELIEFFIEKVFQDQIFKVIINEVIKLVPSIAGPLNTQLAKLTQISFDGIGFDMSLNNAPIVDSDSIAVSINGTFFHTAEEMRVYGLTDSLFGKQVIPDAKKHDLVLDVGINTA